MNTNLKIVLFVLAAVGFFVGFASSIPQIESRPPADTTLGVNMSPAQLAEAGKAVVTGDKIGCLNCHGVGQPGPRAPDLAGVGARAQTRFNEADYTGHATNAEGYLRESLLDPCVYKVKGYDCLMGGLAIDKNLTPAEITAVVAYLQSLGGEITVSLSAQDLAAAPAGGGGGAGLAGKTAQEIVANAGCGGCHTLSALGLAGKVGPDLSAIGARANPDYIRQSIIDPGAVIAKSCPGGPCPDGVMPKNFGGRLTADQLET
ncbi:MAG: c-type cytochrome, partial [Chloroflexi bacterium]|nr:c-type cytochrome [Chloroflexota bacterium]